MWACMRIRVCAHVHYLKDMFFNSIGRYTGSALLQENAYMLPMKTLIFVKPLFIKNWSKLVLVSFFQSYSTSPWINSKHAKHWPTITRNDVFLSNEISRNTMFTTYLTSMLVAFWRDENRVLYAGNVSEPHKMQSKSKNHVHGPSIVMVCY